MKKLSEKRAAELKAAGIDYIIATVRQYYNTLYVKCDTVDGVLKNGGVMYKTPRGYKGYTVGINYNHISNDVKDHAIFFSMI